MTLPILPSEVIENCRRYAERHSVTGMEIWDVVVAASPDTNFLDPAKPGLDEDYSTGEMCVEIISNTFSGPSYQLENDKGKLLISSAAFIGLLDVAKNGYDIANYERRDGRIWAVKEQCWADDL